MRGNPAGLLGCGLMSFVVGCQPEAREPQRDLALAGVALGTQSQPALRSPQEQLVFRRLWEGSAPNFWAASVSPDGRFMYGLDKETNQLAMTDLLTGELKQVADRAGWGRNDHAETALFSPDGRQLAFTYWIDDQQGYEIRTIGVDGSGRRTLVPHAGRGFYAELKDWSEDGRQILARMWDGARPWDDESRPNWRFALISTIDGSIRPLKEFQDWVSCAVCVLSPDGRFVAYDLSSSQRTDYDIYLLPVAGGREVALLTGPADDRLLGWLPDGSGVLFYSDRGMTRGIWLLRVSNGAPAGEPVRLRADVWALEPIGFSRDAYYYGVRTQQPQLHTAFIDPVAWKLVTPPVAIEDPSLGSSGYGLWSPDGRHLAYMRDGRRGPILVIRSVTSADSRELSLSSIQPVMMLGWTADSRAVLMVARDADNIGVFKLDLDTGTPASIWALDVKDMNGMWSIQFARDLKTAYFARPDPGFRTAVIVARDLASGREREIATVGGIQVVLLSPDGRTLAFSDGERPENPTRIATVPVAGGDIKEVYREASPDELQIPTALNWSPDGRYLMFADLDRATNRYSL